MFYSLFLWVKNSSCIYSNSKLACGQLCVTWRLSRESSPLPLAVCHTTAVVLNPLMACNLACLRSCGTGFSRMKQMQHQMHHFHKHCTAEPYPFVYQRVSCCHGESRIQLSVSGSQSVVQRVWSADYTFPSPLLIINMIIRMCPQEILTFYRGSLTPVVKSRPCSSLSFAMDLSCIGMSPVVCC